jgi:hypothetical protein
MADKKSLAEAIMSIRRQKKIVKKSIAGIGREFDFDKTPQEALTSIEGSTKLGLTPTKMKQLEEQKIKEQKQKEITIPVVEKTEPEPAPLQPLRRKLRLPKSKAEPLVEEKKEEPVMEEKKEEPIVEEKAVKDPVVKIEKKPTKYRIKRNTMVMYL